MEMLTNDPIAMNARKQALKAYVRQQLAADYQECPFFVMAQATPEANATTTITCALPEALNRRIYAMASASPLHRLSLFSACIKYLAFAHSHESLGALNWALGAGELGQGGASASEAPSHSPSDGLYVIPAQWRLTETELAQPVKQLIGAELRQWKQVAGLIAGLSPQSASGDMSAGPQVLVGYSETGVPCAGIDASQYRLCIGVEARPEATRLHLRFNPDQVDPALAALLLERLRTLMEAMAFDPGGVLASMPWIPPAEQARIDALSAPTQGRPLAYRNVAQAIAASIRDRGEQVFFECDDQTVNFKQLDGYIDALLQAPNWPHWDALGDYVLIVGDKGVETTLAAMVCMRIGKPFCLQSRQSPIEQLSDVVALHGTQTVLLQDGGGELEQRFVAQGCRVVILPSYSGVIVASAPASVRDEALRKGDAASLDDPLCVVMTSGSEGKPKGCVNTHRALLNICQEERAQYHTDHSRVASVANHTFDYFVLECVLALTEDVVIVVAPEAARTDAAKCVDFLREQRIDLMFTTTVLAEDIMAQGDITSLRQLYFGGESLRAFQKNNYELINLYGPSETGVLTTYQKISRNDQKITIGRPFNGCQCVVAFPDTLQPCPIGAPGELLIGGAGVGAGYLNRPDLTENAFIELDNGALQGRFYRSGDICCWDANGELEILGRRDRQLKVNGFRVELDAVERKVLDLPGVSQAAVISLTDQRGHARLGAFIVANDSGLNERDVRERLLQRTPAYMVPSQIILTPSLPLNRNDKLDRQKLKQMLSDVANSDLGPRPQGRTQEWLAACWARHLELEVSVIGADRSFFALGGHSLRAGRVLAEIQQEFGQAVTLLEFFKHDAIASLAALIDARCAGQREGAGNAFSRLLDKAAESGEVVRGELSPQEARLYAQYRLHPDSMAYVLEIDIPLARDVASDTVKQALQALLDRHAILRTRYPLDEQGAPCAEALATLNVDQVLIGADADWTRAFALERGPLLRGCLLEPQTERARLHLQVHHILVDKPSMEMLKHEFEQLLRGAQPSPSSLSYRRYAQALAQARQQPLWGEAQAFWKDYLEDLDFDPFGHGAVDDDDGVKYTSWSLTAMEIEAVNRLCARHNVTPAVFFLGIWGLAVAREGRSDGFSISVANAYRPPQAQTTVGMFVSLSPCAFRFDRDEECFDAYLKSLAEAQWRAMEQLFFPVEEVFALLRHDPRVFGANPLLNVAYSYFDAEEESDALASDGTDKENDEEAHGPLNLTVFHGGDHSRLMLEYQRAALSDARIAKLAASYRDILRQALGDSSTPRLKDLLVAGDIAAQAFRPAQRREAYRSIEDILRQGFLTLGDRPAVIDDEGELSWAGLASLTGSYADRLNRSEIRRALIQGRPGRRLQAFLAACFLTRTTYLALEEGTPQARVEEVIRHGQPDIVLNAEDAIAARDVDWRQFASLKSMETNPTAWILYSSGTTGRPKGICVAAQTVAQYLDSLVRTLNLQPGARVTQQFSPSFDGYLEEVLLAWAVQGTSLVTDRYSLLDERRAKAFLAQRRPDVISAAPALFSAWNRMENLAPLPKVCISGGDFLTLGDIDRLLQRTQIWNSYGPTETCIAVSMANCADMDSAPMLSIGAPLDHVSFAVVDAQGCRLRPGQWGELLIYGDFAQHGYLNEAELTAQKFGNDDQGAYFRTGDMAMVDASGQCFLKGRMDDSCKVRGNFIGLGELESRAGQHPGVIAAGAAVAQAGTPEACLVLAVEGDDDGGSGLQAHLARHYPRSHLPSAIFPVTRLPRTETGKLDRAQIVALFQAWRERAQVASDAADPAWDEEQGELAACWRECLGFHGALTPDSDFFQVSGSSLSAVRLASQIERRFGVPFSPVDVFRHATLAAQRALIATRRQSRPMAGACLQERLLNADDPRLPKWVLLPPALGGLVELQGLADALAGSVTLSVLTLEPGAAVDLSAEALQTALADALSALAAGRRETPARPLWLGGYSLGAEMLAALLTQRPELGQDVEQLVFLDPNLQTSVFDGPELYAEFLAMFRDIAASAEDSETTKALAAIEDEAALREASPSLFMEWRYYRLQHQLIQPARFPERLSASPLNRIPTRVFLSDDADEKSAAALQRSAPANAQIRRLQGDHVEFLRRLGAEDVSPADFSQAPPVSASQPEPV
ncbi:Non-ribosomal peptide synthetase modules and related protein [Hahella chejuensis KCTC 2396]|uniref:Non-ribosomal peptide synthetase modules and related protein n=1 Tax=Hahella chejuensis (strain KCTC 2396) TaxID=349521 RepID=Q2SGN3_HAHCH|nr:AMP-binding protein [Hahella chejuensis]ABC30191.1 Non-ribosomal peptide synthetase modules and related protein [Hahella chejuensis KCTC 2396]